MVIMKDKNSTNPAIVAVPRYRIFNNKILILPSSACCFSDEEEGRLNVSLKIPGQAASTIAASGIHLIKDSAFFGSGHYGGKGYESNKRL
jgi:hypothetical protein